MNRRALAIALLLSVAVGCEGPSGLTDQFAATLEIVTGDGQVGRRGQPLPNPLVVRALDDKGKAIRGQVVNFKVVEGGGDVFAGVAITNKGGIGQERWTLGTSGPQRLEARAVDPTTGEPITFAVFTATLLDDLRPVVHEVAVTPNPADVTEAVALSALVDDATSGNSAIASAEYNIDGGAFIAMAADDGAFDSPTEAVSATLPAFGGSGGAFTVCVHGTDAVGNISEESCIAITIRPPGIDLIVNLNLMAGSPFSGVCSFRDDWSRMILVFTAENVGSVPIGGVVSWNEGVVADVHGQFIWGQDSFGVGLNSFATEICAPADGAGPTITLTITIDSREEWEETDETNNWVIVDIEAGQLKEVVTPD